MRGAPVFRPRRRGLRPGAMDRIHAGGAPVARCGNRGAPCVTRRPPVVPSASMNLSSFGGGVVVAARAVAGDGLVRALGPGSTILRQSAMRRPWRRGGRSIEEPTDVGPARWVGAPGSGMAGGCESLPDDRWWRDRGRGCWGKSVRFLRPGAGAGGDIGGSLLAWVEWVGWVGCGREPVVVAASAIIGRMGWRGGGGGRGAREGRVVAGEVSARGPRRSGRSRPAARPVGA